MLCKEGILASFFYSPPTVIARSAATKQSQKHSSIFEISFKHSIFQILNPIYILNRVKINKMDEKIGTVPTIQRIARGADYPIFSMTRQ